MQTLEGMIAPKFSLKNEAGEIISLDNFAGKKYVVLYFYPKDSTPGCTTEACDFRDTHEAFADLNAVILGVSADNEKDHTKFIEKHGLPFSLLVDDTHEVSEAYGVWKLTKINVMNCISKLKKSYLQMLLGYHLHTQLHY